MATYTESIIVTANDVYSAVGSNADVNTLNAVIPQAQSVIETLTGVIFDASLREVAVSKTDVAWIKKAVIFQTQWMLDNPDSLSRTDAASISQDGVSVTAGDKLTFVVAPLAKRALANASWSKSGTIRVAVGDREPVEDFLVSDDDSQYPWIPLGAI